MEHNEFNIHPTVPLLLLKNDVLLPHAILELETDDTLQRRAAEDAYQSGGLILVAPDPETNDLSEALVGCVGAVAEVVAVRITENNTALIKLEGFQRCEIAAIDTGARFPIATAILHPDADEELVGETEFLRRELIALFTECAKFLLKGLRQGDFEGLRTAGELTQFNWD